MALYNQRLEQYRSWNPVAQQYFMNKAERIGLMIWKKRTYLMPSMASCMARV